MKRLPCAVVLTSLLASVAYAGARLVSPRVYVNGLPLREPAIVQDGVTYVPLRAVAEALHCRVVYDKKTGVQIWSAFTPNPAEPTPGIPQPPDPHPRPALPQLPGARE